LRTPTAIRVDLGLRRSDSELTVRRVNVIGLFQNYWSPFKLDATGRASPAMIDYDFQNNVTAYIAACCRANASRVALPTVTETVLGIVTARHCTVQGIESPTLSWV
jgi:hypothetical protein